MEKTTSQPKKKEKKKEKEKKHVESRKKGESWSTYKRKTEKEKGGRKRGKNTEKFWSRRPGTRIPLFGLRSVATDG